ncbi:hypothetical protein [uncultured Amphritea sp.]|uniref:hypothetical protein n=1 Tax=uncultured Amphritea sp. TaxID=981605 RepID=UPI0025D48B61|nr:hypothetical protein [uncultured Amphritea sp.]
MKTIVILLSLFISSCSLANETDIAKPWPEQQNTEQSLEILFSNTRMLTPANPQLILSSTDSLIIRYDSPEFTKEIHVARTPYDMLPTIGSKQLSPYLYFNLLYSSSKKRNVTEEETQQLQEIRASHPTLESIKVFQNEQQTAYLAINTISANFQIEIYITSEKEEKSFIFIGLKSMSEQDALNLISSYKHF